MLAVGYPGKDVKFAVTGSWVALGVELVDGNESVSVAVMVLLTFVGLIVVSAVPVGYIACVPSSLAGIAVPTPSLVQGVGTGKREVAGRA
jgi:hypothetical protein